MHQPLRDFGEEFEIEPFEQAAHFDAASRILGHQAVLLERQSARLVQIFRNDIGPRNSRHIGAIGEDGREAGGIKGEKSLPSLKSPLLDQLWLNAIFAERDPDKARMGAKRKVIKLRHRLN
jgi:hypothetical protein